MLLMYYIFRFERNVTGSNHYHNHLQSLAMKGFRQRHNQFQLSNEYGSQAYANMLQYLSRERIRQWNSRIKIIHRGCSELYVLFRTLFSYSLVEMVINSVLESEIQTTRSRRKDENGGASPGLFIASALDALGGDVSNCIYSIYMQYVWLIHILVVFCVTSSGLSCKGYSTVIQHSITWYKTETSTLVIIIITAISIAGAIVPPHADFYEEAASTDEESRGQVKNQGGARSFTFCTHNSYLHMHRIFSFNHIIFMRLS